MPVSCYYWFHNHALYDIFLNAAQIKPQTQWRMSEVKLTGSKGVVSKLWGMVRLNWQNTFVTVKLKWVTAKALLMKNNKTKNNCTESKVNRLQPGMISASVQPLQRKLWNFFFSLLSFTRKEVCSPLVRGDTDNLDTTPQITKSTRGRSLSWWGMLWHRFHAEGILLSLHLLNRWQNAFQTHSQWHMHVLILSRLSAIEVNL